MRKVGAEFWLSVPRWKDFFEGNLDTRVLTTLGLVLCGRSGKSSAKISIVNQEKKGGVLLSVTVEI